MITANAEAVRQSRHYKDVRGRLWGKSRPVNVIEDLRRASEVEEVNKARERREREMRALRFRLALEREEEKRKALAKEDRERRKREAAERRAAAEEARRARLLEEEEAKNQPKWEDIAPHLTAETIEEVAAQVLEFFPRYTLEKVLAKDRSARRTEVLRIVCTGIRVMVPNVTLTEISVFCRRDYSTIAILLAKTHLAENIKRRPSFKKSKIKPHAELVRQRFLEGMRHLDIAREIGVVQSAISRFIKKQGWTR